VIEKVEIPKESRPDDKERLHKRKLILMTNKNLQSTLHQKTQEVIHSLSKKVSVPLETKPMLPILKVQQQSGPPVSDLKHLLGPSQEIKK
jgi:hypothetical protein